MKKDNRKFIASCIIIPVGICFFSIIVAIVLRILLVTDVHFWNFTDDQASLIAILIQGIVGAAAAGFVLYELKLNRNVEARQRDIEEAQFILQYNQAFIQDEKMCSVESCLELWMEKRMDRDQPLITDLNRQQFINYLVYLEGLAPLVFSNVLKFEHVDDLMAYRFFLAVNNPKVQQDQLIPYADYYRGCFKLYAIWKQYRLDSGYPIPLVEYSIDKWEKFEEYSEFGVEVRKLKMTDDFKTVAGLVYDTDPYIYPSAFGSKQCAQKVLPSLMNTDSLFHFSNFYVAVEKKKICGIALVIDSNAPHSVPVTPCFVPKKGFIDVSEKYFKHIDALASEINAPIQLVCLCVNKRSRKRRIGEAILKSILKDYKKSDIILDVLADNQNAIMLYKKYDFEQGSCEPGYSYKGEPPACYQMRKAKSSRV